MRRSFVVSLVVMAAVVTGCRPGTDGSASTGASGAEQTGSGSPIVRVALPANFPLMPGAAPLRMPDDDSGVIGLWTTDEAGSATYDFYAAALPAAGYPVAGLYPGGAAAVIRFRLPDGAIRQVVIRPGPDGSVRIEVRLDRP